MQIHPGTDLCLTKLRSAAWWVCMEDPGCGSVLGDLLTWAVLPLPACASCKTSVLWKGKKNPNAECSAWD